jgi:hypothetical protein
LSDKAGLEPRPNLDMLLSQIEEELDFVVKIYPRYASKAIGRRVVVALDWQVLRSVLRDAREKAITIPEELLKNHGLTGEPLISKMDYLWFAIDKVHKSSGKLPVSTMRRVLSWFLDILDNLLESLEKVFPPIGAVTEFKKQLESGLNVPKELERIS